MAWAPAARGRGSRTRSGHGVRCLRMASESHIADVREWYIIETSRILIDADKQLHSTGSIDIQQLFKCLTLIQEERDLTLKNLGLEINSPMACNECQTGTPAGNKRNQFNYDLSEPSRNVSANSATWQNIDENAAWDSLRSGS